MFLITSLRNSLLSTPLRGFAKPAVKQTAKTKLRKAEPGYKFKKIKSNT